MPGREVVKSRRCPACGSDLVTQSTCPDGYADCFACGNVCVPDDEEDE